MKDRDNRRFGRTGVITCRLCKRQTRETGAGETYMKMCAYCIAESELENSLNDGAIDEAEHARELAELKRRFKRNPPLVVFGNPRRLPASPYKRPVGDMAGEVGEVYAIVYRHSETGELLVHGFGPRGDDVLLKTLPDGVQITRLDVEVGTNVYAYAVEQRGRRTVRLSHAEGEPLWDDR